MPKSNSVRRKKKRRKGTRKEKKGISFSVAAGLATLLALGSAWFFSRPNAEFVITREIVDLPTPTAPTSIPYKPPIPGEIAQREAHLEKLLSGTEIPHCEGVVYDHNGDKIIAYTRSEYEELGQTGPTIEAYINAQKRDVAGGRFHAITLDLFEYSGRERSTKIFVGRRLFENRTDDRDKKHAIVALQGHHVQQHAKGLPYLSTEKIVEGVRKGLIDKPVLYEICALEANYQGLQKIDSGEFPVTKKYHGNLKIAYNRNVSRLLTKVGTGSAIQRDLVFKALKANTP
ncbi:hypothetical protein CMO91_05185 [Candidatus Woesearchaeota archaeon]|nr:hypothetical protein [Candidatus Woesearchaeota archaeon]